MQLQIPKLGIPYNITNTIVTIKYNNNNNNKNKALVPKFLTIKPLKQS